VLSGIDIFSFPSTVLGFALEAFIPWKNNNDELSKFSDFETWEELCE